METKNAHERRPIAIREFNMILFNRALFLMKIAVNCAFLRYDHDRHVYIAMFTFSDETVPMIELFQNCD